MLFLGFNGLRYYDDGHERVVSPLCMLTHFGLTTLTCCIVGCSACAFVSVYCVIMILSILIFVVFVNDTTFLGSGVLCV